MQLAENDIRCDVCALRIKTEKGEPMETLSSPYEGKVFHVHAVNTNPAWRDDCVERARLLGWNRVNPVEVAQSQETTQAAVASA